jgi:hypothetical protein
MALTSKERITEWLRESVDESYYRGRYKLMQKLVDPVSSDAGDAVSAHEFPIYPLLKPVAKEKGVTNMALQALNVTRARVLGSVPEPHFSDVDEFTNSVRQGVWKARVKWNGTNTDGFTQIQAAWTDGWALGSGFVETGLTTDREGYRKGGFMYVPLHRMIWDGYVRSFCDAQMACSVVHLKVADARNRFGKKVDDYVHTEIDPNGKTVRNIVRLFKYYDLGDGQSEPTMAYILGDICNEPFDVKPNIHNRLPFGYYEHELDPGAGRPTGVMDAIFPDIETVNDAERSVRAEVRRPGFNIVASDLLDEEKLADVIAGMSNVTVPTERPLQQGEVPYVQVPAGEVSNTTLIYLQNAKDSFRANAGVSELEQGQDVEGADTLGEVQLVDQRSKTQGNWTVFQTARFFQRVVDAWSSVVLLGDDCPALIDVMGINVEVNNGDPRMALTEWFSEPSDVIVSTEEILKGDTERERQNKIARLNALLPELQAGIIDPVKYTEEKLKALGYDPKKFMAMYQQEAAMMQPGQQQPGQEQQPATSQVA